MGIAPKFAAGWGSGHPSGSRCEEEDEVDDVDEEERAGIGGGN
jgi:hypothetical protein